MKGLLGKSIVDGFGYSSAFDSYGLAKWMIHRSGRAGTAEAIRNVVKFGSSDESEMVTVYAIGGVKVDRTHKLNKNMSIMPISELPESQQRNEMLGLITGVSLQIQPLRQRPVSGVVLNYKINVKTKRSEKLSKEWFARRRERETELEEALLCMGIAWRGVVDLVAAWTQPADEKTPGIFPTCMISTHVSGAPRRIPRCIDVPKLVRVLKLLSEFQGDRKSLHVPMKRLNSAMFQSHIADRAIDLGIALESLLMNESAAKGRSDNQEIRFKIGVRGAWLSGRNPDERHGQFKNIQKIYDLRSAAVHSGEIRSGDFIKMTEQLDAGEDLSASLILKILENGRWPEWGKIIFGQE